MTGNKMSPNPQIAILNFGHHLTTEQVTQIESLVGQKINPIIDLATRLNLTADIYSQIENLLNKVPNNFNFQIDPYIVNLPGLSILASVVLVCLHGHSGYFPPVLHILGKPPDFHLAPYSVFEVINLQIIRDRSRKQRKYR